MRCPGLSSAKFPRGAAEPWGRGVSASLQTFQAAFFRRFFARCAEGGVAGEGDKRRSQACNLRADRKRAAAGRIRKQRRAAAGTALADGAFLRFSQESERFSVVSRVDVAEIRVVRPPLPSSGKRGRAGGAAFFRGMGCAAEGSLGVSTEECVAYAPRNQSPHRA